MAVIQQGVESIFDTDQFAPLVEPRRRSVGRRTATTTDERAMRILADHSRAMTFLIGRRRRARPTRTAATSCAASCAARSSRGTGSASRAASCPPIAEQVDRDDGRAYPELRRAARRDR